jgi:GYF domain 2/Protein of unknown function (DUF2628)
MSAALNLKTYTVNSNGSQQGPLTISEIQILLQSGKLQPSALVWTEGMENWAEIKTIPELGNHNQTPPSVTLVKTPPPLPAANAPFVSSTSVKSGIQYYDEKVFPETEKGNPPFNWMVLFFSPYWLGYKGMWETYAKWLGPIAIAAGFALAIEVKSPGIALLINIGIFAAVVVLGKRANQLYHSHCQKKPGNKDSVGKGIAGLFLYLFIAGIVSGILTASSQHKANTSSNTNQGTNVNQETAVNYTNTSAAVMDGTEAVGKTIQFSGLYGGIQTIEGRPVVYAMDMEAGTPWFILFQKNQKATIAKLQAGEMYNFVCQIQRIATMGNVCVLK